MKRAVRNFLLIAWASIGVAAAALADPTITTQPIDQTVSSDKDVTFGVAATGTAPLQYHWYYRSYSETGGGAWIPSAGTSGTSATYTVHAADYLGQFASQFCCVVSNAQGSKTSRFASLTVYKGFLITREPQDERTTVGKTATFDLESTPVASTYKWTVKSTQFTTTVPSYTTPVTKLTDNLSSVLVVLSNAGGDFGLSSVVELIVDSDPAAGVPSIVNEPADQTIAAGKNVTLHVGASGNLPLTYQWWARYVTGAAYILPGATSATYTFKAVENAIAFQYCCVVSNAQGKKTSRFATVTVYTGFYFTQFPTDQRVKVGETATFTLAVFPAATKYQWYLLGKKFVTSVPTFTSPPVKLTDNLSAVLCFVSNGDPNQGFAISPEVTLVVESDSSGPVGNTPTITQQPVNQTVTVGQTATFSVTASGTAPLNYQWKKKGVDIPSATLASYTTPATTLADNGAVFTVVVTNSVGFVISQGATLTVTGTLPTITQQPINQTVTVGQTATFSVTASGTAPLSYQWKKKGTNIPSATLASYTTPATTLADNGAVFTVLVTNSVGFVTSQGATLTVNPPVPPDTKPTITQQPINQTVTVGQTATFSVTASGTAPLNYQWKKKGVDIPSATLASYTTPATTLADNGAVFTVVVTNSVGFVISQGATLTVTGTLPTITQQPINQTVTVGDTATFSVTASGTAPLSYQWKKKGADIPSATLASYTTPAATLVDSGAIFTVVVTNSVGFVQSQGATLTVNPPVPPDTAPTITLQPINQTVTVGKTATFSVTASGTAPLSYQWLRDGLKILAATLASYTTSAMSLADNGSVFSVIVTNSVDFVTSQGATLIVTAPSGEPNPVSAPAASEDLNYINTKEGKLAYFQGTDITVKIYSRSGALEKTLRGTNLQFDGGDLSAGVHLYSKNDSPLQKILIVH